MNFIFNNQLQFKNFNNNIANHSNDAFKHYYQTLPNDVIKNNNIKNDILKNDIETLIKNNFIEIGKELYKIDETTEEYNLDVIIETNCFSSVQYVYNTKKEALVCEKINNLPFNTLFNIGIIPKTLYKNNKPIDVIIITDNSLIYGSYINCKIIGCCEINTQSNSFNHSYLIVCPSQHIDESFEDCHNIIDFKDEILTKLSYMLLYKHNLNGQTNLNLKFKQKNDGIQFYEMHKSIF